MGRRSRKQRAAGSRDDEQATGAPEGVTPPAPSQRSGRRQSRVDRMLARAEERPKPPWHPVPLVELAVLMGIVLIVIGFFTADSARGRLALVFGLLLASVAGLDTAGREHFAGQRSHSTLLAGFPALVAGVVAVSIGVAYAAAVAIAVAVFALAFWRLRATFKRKAGVAFKV